MDQETTEISDKECTSKAHETSEQVSSKDQENTDKSSESEIKDETKNKEKEKEVMDINKQSSEGELNDKIAESSEQISSMDQETTEKSDKECTSNEIDVKTEEIKTIGSIDENDESPVEAMSLTEKSSEGETKQKSS